MVLKAYLRAYSISRVICTLVSCLCVIVVIVNQAYGSQPQTGKWLSSDMKLYFFLFCFSPSAIL